MYLIVIKNILLFFEHSIYSLGVKYNLDFSLPGYILRLLLYLKRVQADSCYSSGAALPAETHIPALLLTSPNLSD